MLEITQPGTDRQNFHLPARIVDVVLALYAVAHGLQQIGDGSAEGGMPAVADVQGTGWVRRDEFHLYRPAGAHLRSAILPPLSKHPADFRVIGILRQKEIDEAGARDVDLGYRGAGRK